MLKRTATLLAMLISCILCSPAMAAGGGQTATAKPNIILMMADDLGYGDVGFNGNNLVKTPHLDKMAKDGLRFTRFYSVGPICSPTRASVQTGRHYMRFGMMDTHLGKLPKGEINIARIAKSLGYATGHFGKWHLGTLSKDPKLTALGNSKAAEYYGPPWERAYDTTFTTETNIATWDPSDDKSLHSKHRLLFWENGKQVKGNFMGSSDGIITDRALNFIKDAVANKQPFMTTLWFYAPHAPVRAGKELRDLYPGQPLGRQHYLGCITAIDNQVERIRNCLQELGVENNTLIFFCSDNGPEGDGKPPKKYTSGGGAAYGSAGGFKGRKRSLYNGGVCVPAFAYWPGTIEGGRETDEPVCVLDYLPTFAALTGYRMPDERPIDGTNLMPLLKGKPWKRETYIPFATNLREKWSSIIDGDYKLISYVDKRKADELYHIHNDPAEKQNLKNKKPEIAATMKKKLLAWVESARHSYYQGDYPGYEKQGDFLGLPTNKPHGKKYHGKKKKRK